MKLKRKICFVLMLALTFTVLAGVFSLTSFAAETSGKCGDNLNWAFNSATGELKITGTGEMTDYPSSFNVPWRQYNESITSLNITNGATSIGLNAFYDIQNLTELTIPASLKKISNYAFSYLNVLEKISITSLEAWCNIEFEKIVSNPMYHAISNTKLYLNGTLIENLEIPNTVEIIKPYAFAGFYSIKSVNIPNSVKSIGMQAFYRCENLTELTVPDSVKKIETAAFLNCTRLKSITLPFVGDGEKITKFTHIFGGSIPAQLKNVTITGGTAIDDYAFLNCENLVRISLPDGIKTIGEDAFAGCLRLGLISIPKSVTKISEFAFYKCDELVSVYYAGTQSQWRNIEIEKIGNKCLAAAEILYNQTENPLSTEAVTTTSDTKKNSGGNENTSITPAPENKSGCKSSALAVPIIAVLAASTLIVLKKDKE